MSSMKRFFTKPLNPAKLTTTVELDLVLTCRLSVVVCSSSLPSIQHFATSLLRAGGLRTTATPLSTLKYDVPSLLVAQYPDISFADAKFGPKAVLTEDDNSVDGGGGITIFLHGALRFTSPPHSFVNAHSTLCNGLTQLLYTLRDGGCKVSCSHDGASFTVRIGRRHGKLGQRKRFALTQLKAVAATAALTESILDSALHPEYRLSGSRSVRWGPRLSHCVDDVSAVLDEVFYCASVVELRTLLNCSAGEEEEEEEEEVYKSVVGEYEIVFRQHAATTDVLAAERWVWLVNTLVFWAAVGMIREQQGLGAVLGRADLKLVDVLQLLDDEGLTRAWL